MATVQLRDIRTDTDRQAVLGLQRGPGYGFTKTGEVKWGEDLLRLDLPHGPDGHAAPRQEEAR